MGAIGAETEGDLAPAEWASRIVARRDETPSVSTFSFEPPDEPFSFRSGQYLVLTLPGTDDSRGESRTFSISSPPSERSVLSVTTRRGPSPFKQRLFSAPVGEPVGLWAPFGTFLLDKTRPSIMVGGGIGVTPFRSMLLELERSKDSIPRTLLYSSRVPEEIVYREEFDELARRWKSFRWVPYVTRPEEGHQRWDGRTGRLDAERLRADIEGAVDPIYYVCGPPGMVKELLHLLVRETGISARHVRSEAFQGY